MVMCDQMLTRLAQDYLYSKISTDTFTEALRRWRKWFKCEEDKPLKETKE